MIEWIGMPLKLSAQKELGGHVARCENAACGHTEIAYNSCRNRHCPKCQGAASRSKSNMTRRPTMVCFDGSENFIDRAGHELGVWANSFARGG